MIEDHIIRIVSNPDGNRLVIKVANANSNVLHHDIGGVDDDSRSSNEDSWRRRCLTSDRDKRVPDEQGPLCQVDGSADLEYDEAGSGKIFDAVAQGTHSDGRRVIQAGDSTHPASPPTGGVYAVSLVVRTITAVVGGLTGDEGRERQQ